MLGPRDEALGIAQREPHLEDEVALERQPVVHEEQAEHPRVIARRELALGLGVVRIGSAIMVRSEEAGEVPAGRRERKDLLAAAAGVIVGEERADEIGLEGGDEALANGLGGHRVSQVTSRATVGSVRRYPISSPLSVR